MVAPLDALKSTPLTLTVFEETQERVIEGCLKNQARDIYPIINFVLYFSKGDLEPDHIDFYKCHNIGSGGSEYRVDQQKEPSKTNRTFSNKRHRFSECALSTDHREFLICFIAVVI